MTANASSPDFDFPCAGATIAGLAGNLLAKACVFQQSLYPALHPHHGARMSDPSNASEVSSTTTTTAGDDDFIHVRHDCLDRAWCSDLVERFGSSNEVQPGQVGGGVHVDLKDSLDLTISGRPEWRDVEASLNTAMFKALLEYVRRWPHTLIAPLMLEVPDAQGQHRRLTPDVLRAMDDAALAPIVRTVLRPAPINLQRYHGGRGGYPYWHCELYPRDAHAETLHRHLLWTVYLNDDFEQGETEFLYQRRRITPRTGSLLIAPAGFTHTHRGNRPHGGDKVIATSWILFQRAETLYGAG